jgi:hypothetical protein
VEDPFVVIIVSVLEFYNLFTCTQYLHNTKFSFKMHSHLVQVAVADVFHLDVIVDAVF